MTVSSKDCCILNSGNGSWGFESLAIQLSADLEVDISEEPRRFNYLLYSGDVATVTACNLFISLESMRLASDKRLLAACFAENSIRTPTTRLIETFSDVLHFAGTNPDREWCIKFPTGCGANGHRLIAELACEPPNWPRPYVVQEFIRMETPEVFRSYCAA